MSERPPFSTASSRATRQKPEAIQGGYGGYYGGANQDTQGAPTVLSGAIGGSSNGGYSYHVVTGSNVDSTAVLNNFEIEQGSASGSTTDGDGGGLFIDGGSPTISDCVFLSNYATSGGGAVFIQDSSSPTFNADAFDENSTAASGGAILSLSSATITISGNVFGQYRGGGNTAVNGGALSLAAGGALISNTTFAYNSATNFGGAIQNHAGSNLFNVFFTQNTAGSEGGAFYADGGGPSLVVCTFDGNTAGAGNVLGEGGAVYDNDTVVNSIECLFVGNTAADGGVGGAFFSTGSSADPELINCALTSNSAGDGGAVFNNGAQFNISNSILWNDSASAGFSEIDSQTGGLTQNNNDTADPIFFRNPSAGADSVWGTADDDYGDLRVQATSSCIDAGSNIAFTNATAINYDFTVIHSRFVDYPGVGSGGAVIDIGPYEAPAAITVTSQAFELNNNPPDVRFVFSTGIVAPAASAVTIDPVNPDGSLDTAHPVSATSVTYNSGTMTLTFALPTTMTDGNYRATLAAGAVSDSSSDPLMAPASVDFFILPGDANQDRTVNALDFNALATNYGKPGDFSQGDFDYSGVVDVNDFDLLAARFGKTLAAAAMSQPALDLAVSSMPAMSLFSDSKIDDDPSSNLLA